MITRSAEYFEDWRATARELLQAGIRSEDVRWIDRWQKSNTLQFADDDSDDLANRKQLGKPFTVSPKFLRLAEKVASHCDPLRWEVMYRVLWRMTHGERYLLDVSTDDDVLTLTKMDVAVRREAHKTKAFVRFRSVQRDDEEHFVAWHRPDHYVLRLTAPFFSRRFPEMRWTILTPYESAVWDPVAKQLRYGEGVPASEAPSPDELEDLWKTYYGAIFNPARIKLKAMRAEMPLKHWPTLPETKIIPDLLADAPRRVQTMISQTEGFAMSAADFLPETKTLETLAAAAATCEGCDLYKDATQTVFGKGPASARVMMVGECPGDQEDIQGEPFVGPAGKLLDDALKTVGIDRNLVYITNTVKHFKFEPRGRRRLHKKPGAREIAACKPWLEHEIELVQPDVVMCLGATAAQAIIGRDFRITKQRGEFRETDWSPWTIATYHPSALLRAPDPDARANMQAAFEADLQKVANQLRELDSSQT